MLLKAIKSSLSRSLLLRSQDTLDIHPSQEEDDFLNDSDEYEVDVHAIGKDLANQAVSGEEEAN